MNAHVASAIGDEIGVSPADLCAAIQPWQADHVPLPAYVPTDDTTNTVLDIQNLFRLRQNMIQGMTKLTLQAQSTVRLPTTSDEDFGSEEAKAKARKRTESLYKIVVADPEHPLYQNVEPFLFAMEPLEQRRAAYEKEMARLVKKLPIYAWAKSVKGLGDVSLANIIGACGDIGTYKSVSAVWKRMGLAVDGNGNRQGNPGKSATAEDWIAHGYNRRRRSVMWNVGNSLILGMGKFRPLYGEDVDANEEYTCYQRVFARRARYEAGRLPHKCGSSIKESDKGKESYTAHAANRAKRYAEKRLLKDLYIQWRRAAA